MLVRNDVNQNIPNSQNKNQNQSQKQAGTVLGWRELATQRPSPAVKRRRRILAILSILLLITLIFAAIRLAAVASGTNDQLFVHIGNQQSITLDLRQSLPMNPHFLGANVFPPSGTSSQDGAD